MAFCSTDNEISLKISFWESEISHNSLFGERNFVHHFVWGSEISWNISFVGVEIKLNVDEINKSCA